jgi:diguanylate cyclase
MITKNALEVARETLRQLTARHLPPTPVNYQAIYNEIAGIPHIAPFPEEPLRQIAQALPAKNPGQEKQKGLLEFAIGQRNWDGIQNALLAYADFARAESPPAPATTLALTDAADWAPVLTTEFMAQVARLVQNVLPALGSEDARFLDRAEQLIQALREPTSQAAHVKTVLADFNYRLSFVAEDQAGIKTALLQLLHLIIENISELSLDEQWLRGQAEALMEAATPPLTLRRLDEVEHRLKNVIFKQREAKGRAQEAQEELRALLAAFIERLSQMTESSSTFQGTMETCVQLLDQARRVEDITPVLKDVIGAARLMANEARGTRDELRAMRGKAQTTQDELSKLHQELDRISSQVRHDTLTGVLNRKGLNEAIEREISGMQRKNAPLCVALLDVDNFKKINDSKGHAIGDAALQHLVTVARECLRSQDALARYGGEEFVIVLPDTPLDMGVDIMRRLQRQLSARFFLADHEKFLITFSAGVAQLQPDENGSAAISRADKAMYLAKRAGKNRVLAA